MAVDKNPRHWFLDVTSVEANVDGDQDADFVTIEFHGSVTPTLKERLTKAFKEGDFEITVKKFG
jgi:hypothetical protein